MHLAFIDKIPALIFFLFENDGVFRRHLNQHEPLLYPLREHDLFADSFLSHLNLKFFSTVGRGQDMTGECRIP